MKERELIVIVAGKIVRGKFISRFKRFSRSSRAPDEMYKGQHRFEHWYLDNQVSFITARCRDQFNAFASEQEKLVFWDRFDHYCKQ